MAYELAGRYPELVDSLFLLAPAGLRPHKSARPFEYLQVVAPLLDNEVLGKAVEGEPAVHERLSFAPIPQAHC